MSLNIQFVDNGTIKQSETHLLEVNLEHMSVHQNIRKILHYPLYLETIYPESYYLQLSINKAIMNK